MGPYIYFYLFIHMFVYVRASYVFVLVLISYAYTYDMHVYTNKQTNKQKKECAAVRARIGQLRRRARKWPTAFSVLYLQGAARGAIATQIYANKRANARAHHGIGCPVLARLQMQEDIL